MEKTIRLNKYLSSLGLSSRRKVEQLLKERNVTLNGARILEKGIRLNPLKDLLLIDGKKPPVPEFKYFMLNKPKGVISTAKDEHGRKTVVSLIKSKARLFPVGRLDNDSKGLILLTNDGELAQKLTHPKFHIPKTYIILLSGIVDNKKIAILSSGVNLKARLPAGKDSKTAPSEVKIIKRQNNRTLLEITLFEGQNRQIRRMCSSLKLNLLELKRIAIGNVKLGDLKNGQSRLLTTQEIAILKT